MAEQTLGVQPPDTYNPSVVGTLVSQGQDAAQHLAAQKAHLEAIDQVQKGQGGARQTISAVLSQATDANDYNQKLADLNALLPPEHRAVLKEFGPWSPDAPAKALKLGLTPDQVVTGSKPVGVQAGETMLGGPLSATPNAPVYTAPMKPTGETMLVNGEATPVTRTIAQDGSQVIKNPAGQDVTASAKPMPPVAVQIQNMQASAPQPPIVSSRPDPVAVKSSIRSPGRRRMRSTKMR